jgi:hypothetical protein
MAGAGFEDFVRAFLFAMEEACQFISVSSKSLTPATSMAGM